VTIEVEVGSPGAASASAEEGSASAAVIVYVTEVATGQAVVDATVTGGPLGHPTPLALVLPGPYHNADFYTGHVAGYVPDWEFSVERGTDYLKGVVLRGPTYPSINSITCSPAPDSVIVSWSGQKPRTQVKAYVCAIPSGGVWEYCNSGNDLGSLVLTSADQVAKAPSTRFPVPCESYGVDVSLEADLSLSVGSQGGMAEFHVGSTAHTQFVDPGGY
jgi:hypothetical protein